MITEGLAKKVAELIIDNDCEIESVMRALREDAFMFNHNVLSCLENYAEGKWLNKPIKVIFEYSSCSLNKRVYNTLIDNGYKTVKDLYRADSRDIQDLPGIGKQAINSLELWFEHRGLVGWDR